MPSGRRSFCDERSSSYPIFRCVRRARFGVGRRARGGDVPHAGSSGEPDFCQGPKPIGRRSPRHHARPRRRDRVVCAGGPRGGDPCVDRVFVRQGAQPRLPTVLRRRGSFLDRAADRGGRVAPGGDREVPAAGGAPGARAAGATFGHKIRAPLPLSTARPGGGHSRQPRPRHRDRGAGRAGGSVRIRSQAGRAASRARGARLARRDHGHAHQRHGAARAA